MLKKMLLLIVLLSVPVLAHDGIAPRADAHAPIGVMGDHTHPVGEMMFSYRYMTMAMDGNRSGQTQKSVSEVLTDFMVSPLTMTMDMHMLGAMFAPTNELTLMAMLPYTQKSMDHRKRDLTEFNRKSSGLGDVTVSALYQLLKESNQFFHINMGLSLPVGSIDETGGQSARLPYPMQLGSGTYDVQLGGTYVKKWHEWSAGGQLSGLFRLGENKHGYALGNTYTGTAWVSKSLTDSMSLSFRSQAKVWGDINGSDTDLNPNMVPTARTTQGGTVIDMSVGLNYVVSEGDFKGNRLGIEAGLPVIQSLNGTQMETDWWLSLGWQYAL